MVYYVYVIRNDFNGTLYIGFTSDLKHRIKEHQECKSKFTRNTKERGKWHLIYFEGYINKKDAIKREKFLKGGSGYNYLKTTE